MNWIDRALQAVRGVLEDEVERAIPMRRVEDQIWKLLDADPMSDWAWPLDIFVDDDGSLSTIVAQSGKLYHVPVTIEGEEVSLGEWTQVKQTFTPVEERARTIVRQQPDGRHRWFSVSASSVLNRVAEIDSRDLFDSFVAHAEETGEYPVRMLIHMGEKLRTGQADWLARDGDLYLSSGLYDETPLAQLEIQARKNNPDAWGDSIGYRPTQEPELVEVAEGVNVPVYRAGINKEISTLLETDAANLFTVGRIQEVNRMAVNRKQMETLVALHRDAGSEDPEADALTMLDELGVEERNRSIAEEGLVTRDKGSADDAGADDAAEEADAETEDDDVPATLEIDEDAVRVIAEEVLNTELFRTMHEALNTQSAQLTEMVAQLEAREREIGDLKTRLSGMIKRLKVLEREDAEKQQEWVEDLPASRHATRVTYRPRYRDMDEGEDEGAETDDPLSSENIRAKVLSELEPV